VVKSSAVVSNSLNPVWPESDPGSEGEVLILGVHESGAEVLMEAWDADTGLEAADDLIGQSVHIVIPECWYGTAHWSKLNCKAEPEFTDGRWEAADCFATDSAWAMEDRKVCNQSLWVNLDKGTYGPEAVGCNVAADTAGAPACILLEFTVSARNWTGRWRLCRGTGRGLTLGLTLGLRVSTACVQIVPLAVQVEEKIRGAGVTSDLEAVIAEDKIYMFLDKQDTVRALTKGV
jgi:hypothetical protein